MKKRQFGKRGYYLAYTAAFAAMFFLCCGVYFISYKKAPMWNVDTFSGDYQCFIYMGKWLRNWARNIYWNHSFAVPMWSMSIGYGADIPITLAAYVYDPFNWLSALIPPQFSEAGYWIVVVGKYYLMGLSFLRFARHRKCEPYAAIAGVMVYLFSMTSYIGFYHQFFITPMILFPMLIMGVDQLYEDNRPVRYVVFLTLSFLSFIYFAYMMAVLVFLYCALKFLFGAREDRRVRNLGRLFTRFLLYSILSACIAAIALIPSAIQLLGLDRLDIKHVVPLFYNRSINKGIFVGWTTGFNIQSRDSFIGFGVVALVCLFALFMLPKRHNRLKLEAALMTAGLFIPFVGHVMNGFSYTANRWVFAYNFVIAYVCAVVLPELPKLSRAKGFAVAGLIAAYILVARFVFEEIGKNLVAFSCLMILTGCLCIVAGRIGPRIYKYIAVGLSCVSVALFSYFFFSSDQYNTLAQFVDAGTAYPFSIKNGGLPLVKNVKKSEAERFDRYGIWNVKNSVWNAGLGCYDFYGNMYNNNIDRFHNDMAMLTEPWTFGYGGLNRRSELEALMGTRHFFVRAANVETPYGYDVKEYQKKSNGEKIRSYRMERENSIFYLFDRSISYDEYMALEPLERQQLLTQAVVTEKPNASTDDLTLCDDALEYGITLQEGVEFDGHRLHVNWPEARMILSLPKVSASELYVYLQGVYFRQPGEVTWVEQADYVMGVHAYSNGEPLDNRYATLHGNNIYSHMYGGKHNWLLNLGYEASTADSVVITFYTVGDYDVGALRVYARPAAELDESLAGLDCEGLRFEGTVNGFEGDVATDRDRFLFAAIPYSDGWRAYVDGERAEVLRADTGFLAVPLQAGEHRVSFRYHTPGLAAGLALSASSLAIFLVLTRRARKRRETA